MAPVPPPQLSARKSPRQARATATLEAIFEATIQVLLTDGPTRLTTTRVSARAGVSVGTMYQYYPHKQALLYAVTERYLNTVAETVERTCLQNHGAPLAQMSDTLVKAYWDAKTMQRNATRALYLVALEVNTSDLAEACMQRIEAATAAMFDSAPDAKFADLALVNLTFLTVLFGTVRSLFTRKMTEESERRVGDELSVMCLRYLEASKIA
ncbi:TetR/AcrR family transcriptional regulator [Consotaella salsifontis]|uniref:Transcriptional regulator, TetR family n=1 Tax=Consotaella salsifontis TaxID=1365950 RepID=A0A1T4T5T5_9HYPH|nr:TetR/AcrR family transcriptional regulator [Consotaella salsifontis]SKA35621.1 transcriptional regulator, TetR family [Consotaella salsifontis]